MAIERSAQRQQIFGTRRIARLHARQRRKGDVPLLRRHAHREAGRHGNIRRADKGEDDGGADLVPVDRRETFGVDPGERHRIEPKGCAQLQVNRRGYGFSGGGASSSSPA